MRRPRIALSIFAALIALLLSVSRADALCGDGILDLGELCDDTNLIDGDGCDSNCTPTGCGNGVITAPEVCDDTNLIDGDGCDSNCTPTGCGNGVVTGSEVCDDNNLISGDGCDANCTPTACGNGVITAPEVCDDGNLTSGDGCDANCTSTACGNGVVTAPEVCDDGNLISGDGCDASCTFTGCGNGIVTAPEVCDDGNLTSGDGCDANCTPTACGNSIVTAPEACDDGNIVEGDGCDNNCTVTACGNGAISAPEQCDDGNLVNNDGCDANCTPTGCGNGVTTPPEQCDDGNPTNGDGCDANCTPTGCGNGVTTPPEVCDDGNLVSGDGCDASCTLTGCGNGVITLPELCDDGNVTNGDGCDANCTPTGCGNGVATPPEQCDDGNLVNGDGCDSNCTAGACGNGIVVAPLETCDDGNVLDGDGCDSTCQPTGCGSGVVTGNETCDDGNLVNGDGCAANCQREFLNPVAAAADHFGWSVAALGANLIVGVPDFDKPGTLNTGVVYLVSGTGGTILRTFNNPSPEAGDRFGATVAALGGNVVISAPFDNSGGPDVGAVYLFNGATGALIRTFLNPNPGAHDNFGWSVAAFGGNLVIGAPKDTTGLEGGGVAYLFSSIGILSQVYLNPTPAAGDEFGSAVAVVDSHVLVGAPRHNVPPSGFDPEFEDAGEAYLFDGASGVLEHTFANPNPATGDLFGSSVATVDGQALVSAPLVDDGGMVYMFDVGTGAVLQVFQNPTHFTQDLFGQTMVAVGSDRLAIGAPLDDTTASNAGSVFVFHTATGALLETLQKQVPAENDNLGHSVAASGSRVYAGAPYDDTHALDAGAAYGFSDDSCGNGVTEGGETCDDGNIVSGDGCDPNCTATGCGNGVLTTGETCDDGNTTAGDGCSPTCTAEGACGDGTLETFEGCDDGNLLNGDGCDSNCTPTGCGNGIVTAGETCDQGADNGVNLCCSSTCTRVDSDSDGVCDQTDDCPTIADPAQIRSDGDTLGDACDVCPHDVDNDSDGDGYCVGNASNPPAIGKNDPCSRTGGAGTMVETQVRLGRVLVPPEGNEFLRVRGWFDKPTTVPVLAPDRYGIQVRVMDSTGAILLDSYIEGKLATPGAKYGWKPLGSPPTRWKYFDKRDPSITKGVKKVLVRDLARIGLPGMVEVFLAAKNGTYPLRFTSQVPLRVAIELNDTSLPPGGSPGRDQCGEIIFGLPPDVPSCIIKGTTVACK